MPRQAGTGIGREGETRIAELGKSMATGGERPCGSRRHSRSFLHVVPVGIITKEQHTRFLREHPGPEQHTHKRFENLNVRVYGDTGIVNGAVVETTDRSEHKTLFTDVFAYRDGKWQAVSAQELPAATR